MRIDEFRALTETEKVKLINKRLEELKEKNEGTKQFRSDILDFSYATAMKEMTELGYARNGNVFEKELKLTEHEVRLLKNLAYSYEFVMKEQQDQPKVQKRNDEEITTTSARVYNKVWKRWQSFCSEWSIFNAVDLLASAMEDYMDKQNFDDYETLMQLGKIKE